MVLAALGATSVLLAGCTSGMQYALSEYTGVEVKNFEVQDEDTYRVFDKPDARKLMITPSLSRAAGMGVTRGLTFGAAGSDNPKPLYERAALGYLASTGRACRIIDGYVVETPQWEFKYDCSPPPHVATATSRQRK